MVNDRKFLTEFIEEYRNFPCLWNRSDPNYRNLSHRDTAYSFLLEKMKEYDSEASKITVTNKINNIRCIYRKEHLKVLASIENREEQLYEPSLWYYNLMSFLADQLDPPKIFKTEPNNDSYNYNNDLRSSDDSDTSRNPFEEESDVKDTVLTSVDIHNINKKRQLTKINTKNFKLKTNHVVSASLQPLHMDTMEQAAFGNNVAEELRKMPLEMVPIVKKLINDAIFEGHMISLNRFSKIVTPPKK